MSSAGDQGAAGGDRPADGSQGGREDSEGGEGDDGGGGGAGRKSVRAKGGVRFGGGGGGDAQEEEGQEDGGGGSEEDIPLRSKSGKVGGGWPGTTSCRPCMLWRKRYSAAASTGKFNLAELNSLAQVLDKEKTMQGL